ncbi:DUF2179 domain-containing protein [Brevibacillus agri]|uniref:DUF2179 domain-containing protein n=1 Tax=Brevibacillus agri TaxID=51101 RepID=UPI0018CFC857|nr:DUF5698 domain-containing protein [Brevibacillus agri]MBG9566488.1 membrane protein [Brevibacillus agri]
MIYVTIALIQIIYVALNSLRVVLMIKGRNYAAASLCTVEIFVYLSGLSIVLNYMDSFWGIFTYCLSYGVGTLLGMYIEQKIALGYMTLPVITANEAELTSVLKEKGYGVTKWHGSGLYGTRMIFLILAKRKNYLDAIKTIQQIDPGAFIISSEPKTFVGGFTPGKLN